MIMSEVCNYTCGCNEDIQLGQNILQFHHTKSIHTEPREKVYIHALAPH